MNYPAYLFSSFPGKTIIAVPSRHGLFQKAAGITEDRAGSR